MSPVFVFLVALGSVSFLLWALSFDALLRRVHADHHDLWVSLGTPPGWLWSPPDTDWLKGAMARQRLVSDTWIYKPSWIDADPVLRRLWWRMFILAMICFAMPILLMIYAATHPIERA
jgi:hypothetical protein